ncbi:ABC transporter substrate-binding protein [Paenibacillus plantarum]|nr:sugar ABC transporter substrate-binding protein [Paenibacillus plantarum]
MNWKRYAFGMMSTVMAVSLTACTTTKEAAPSASAESKSTTPAKPQEMTFVSWSSEETTGKSIIQDGMVGSWNKKETAFPIKTVGYPWDKSLEQIILKSQAKQDMDIAQVDITWFNTLNKMGVMVDLNTLLDPQWIKDNFDEAALKAGQVDGKQYALPWTVAAISMLYNPVITEKAGITGVPATLQQFEEALAKVKASNPDVIPYAAMTKNGANISQDFQTWLWTNGGSVFDASGNVTINNDKGVQTLTWFKGLFDKGYIKMDIDRVEARNLFSQNKVAFYDDSIVARGFQVSKGISDADMPKHLVPMPRPVAKEGDKQQAKLWGHYLMVSKDSKNPKKAAEFIKSILTDQELAIKYFKSASTPPVIKKIADLPEVKNDAYTTGYLKIAASSKAGETEKYAQSKTMDQVISEEIQAALLNAKTPQKAMDDAAARLKETLKKE